MLANHWLVGKKNWREKWTITWNVYWKNYLQRKGLQNGLTKKILAFVKDESANLNDNYLQISNKLWSFGWLNFFKWFALDMPSLRLINMQLLKKESPRAWNMFPLDLPRQIYRIVSHGLKVQGKEDMNGWWLGLL
jgi:hypothetical protein